MSIEAAQKIKQTATEVEIMKPIVDAILKRLEALEKQTELLKTSVERKPGRPRKTE